MTLSKNEIFIDKTKIFDDNFIVSELQNATCAILVYDISNR